MDYSIKQMFLNLQDTRALLVDVESKSKGELTCISNCTCASNVWPWSMCPLQVGGRAAW